jgi:hypothetical protein
MVDGDTCIICLEENETSNPLIEANEIFETKCGCSYNVHKLCMDEWAKAKKKNFLCINCNSPAKIKNKDFINITIINQEPEPENITPNVQFIIERTPTLREQSGSDCCQELDQLCPNRIVFCFWTIVIFIIVIFLIS